MIKQYFDWSEGKPTNLNRETIKKFKSLDEMLKKGCTQVICETDGQ